MYNTAELIAKMEELGISPKKSLGQNFLVGKHVVLAITQAAKNLAPKSVVEIGPGLGAITEFLRQDFSDFQVLELDKKLCEYWREKQLRVLEGDALQCDWSALNLSEPACLVSNLPYQISSSIVIDRSIYPHKISSMILMFQKEVAERITASCDDDEYGLLSVIAQSFWKINKVCDAGPREFYPPPKIASRVLQFKALELSNEYYKQKPEEYLKFVKQAFAQRRKMLTKNLNISKEVLSAHLQSLGFRDDVRAEKLSPKDFQKLFEYLYKTQ